MLVLSRKHNQKVVIDLRAFESIENQLIEVTIVDISGDVVRLGFDANPEIPIHRHEVFQRIEGEAA